jgi:superfamily II DNA or RNA helicase
MDGTLDRPSDHAEACQVITGLARGRFGRINPDRIAAHVVAVTQGGNWPVRRAALDALARRYASGARDGLAVLKRPAASHGLGSYRTGPASAARGRGQARSYPTTLLSVAPLRMSCGCADFVRGSLGLCRHALVVLDALERAGTLRGSERKTRTRTTTNDRAGLVWDSAHPLVGPADRLSRLRLVGAVRAAKTLAGFRDGSPAASMLRNIDDRLSFLRNIERAIAKSTVDAEPAVVRLIDEELTRAAQCAENHAHVREAMLCLTQLGRRLYPYQREGVKRFFEAGRLLLADDMGLGKTTQAIASCHALYALGRVQRGVLIVPASLKPQWKREWDATTETPLALVEGSPVERARLYQTTRRGFLVLGYEQLLRDLLHVQRFAPDMVVLDEAQRIKNWATKSAGYVKSLTPRYRLVLTGTPMENRFDELASIMDFVDDVALEPKWRLAAWHTMQDGDGGRGVSGARHLETLRQRMAAVMLRRVRHDVLSQLPGRTDTRVPVEMTEPQRREHDELNQPIAVLMQKAARRPLTQPEFLHLMQLLTTQRMICNGLGQLRFDQLWPRCVAAGRMTPELLDGLFAPKLSALRGLVEQVVIDQRRKAVVFSQWRKMLRLAEWSVRDVLSAAGMRAVFFTGAESSKQRERAIVDFHDDPAATVMFLSDAGGVGLNLQRAASCCINIELPWNPAVLEQRIGRIYRLGQTQPIDVYNLVSEEGIEARIAAIVAQKQAVFTSLFDGTTDALQFDGKASFLESVKKLVEPLPIPLAQPIDQIEPEAVTELTTSETDLDSSESPVDDASAGGIGEPAISRLADGGLRIDVPPELAVPFAGLLEALAKSLRQASTGGTSPRILG